MAIRPMRASDRESVLDLMEVAFERRGRVEIQRYLDFDPLFKPSDFLLDVEGGQLRSCVQVFEKRIRLCGTTVKLGGIGSVATNPAHRKSGFASALMRAQTEAMRERSMPLALLFAGPFEFYEKLGWHRFPLRQVVLKHSSATKTVEGREFRDSDLPAVMSLYDAYSADLDGTTLRDETYWRSQLLYAGGRDFRVLERAGTVVAYARSSVVGRLHCLLEYACAPGHAADLAPLVAGLVPDGGALIARLAADPRFEPALRETGLELTDLPDPTPMWRVLDGDGLARTAGSPPGTGDFELLRALHERPLHYWLADRF